MRTYSIVVEPEPDGSSFVTVPALPGCFTRGKTIEECQERAVEAIQTYIAGLEADGEPDTGGARHSAAHIGDRRGMEQPPKCPVHHCSVGAPTTATTAGEDGVSPIAVTQATPSTRGQERKTDRCLTLTLPRAIAASS